MKQGSENLALASGGVLLFCLAVLANVIRIAVTGSIAATLDLYVVHEPALLVELLLALVLGVLVVEGTWTPRTVAGMAVGGVLIMASTVWGIYDYWEFAEASAFPVAKLVWLFLGMQLLGGLLLVAGTLRELQSSPDSTSPESI